MNLASSYFIVLCFLDTLSTVMGIAETETSFEYPAKTDIKGPGH